jgi:hypothetical protein
MAIVGGVALILLPAIAYGDYYFGDFGGASFAFVTVPLMNLGILGGVVLVDQALMGYARRRSRRGPGA